MPIRHYSYVGPADIKAMVAGSPAGTALTGLDALARWHAAQPPDERAEPFTYVVGLDGVLRVAPRRSEHVACAGGASVLAAGEIAFECGDGQWSVTSVSNQSTGYCPDVTCWPAVAAALDQLGVAHPAAFTTEVQFRRCLNCRELTIVRDGDFVCVFCDADLPAGWNIGAPISPDPLV
ncbi:conserved hypothetical protein [Catenulispora acidiphila DSM 44928]|uniref:Uncharacterized protein n=1 Tax=Catenulispora acidiphila (strain DSM 44928 / JCM 14897 / NBRC 102108 / NRRL B-24433 / ID139908) TaxID=479433 RepID=C7QIH6_CATAD|nr:hypothetical protein [Catenulispora acidiphila]ACU75053.1 conserved hypothetical protein [Catenulispora acidiphila DSM 44928]